MSSAMSNDTKIDATDPTTTESVQTDADQAVAKVLVGHETVDATREANDLADGARAQEAPSEMVRATKKRKHADETSETTSPIALPKDAQEFILNHAAYGVNGYVSSKRSDRKVLVIGHPYYWKNPTIAFDEIPSSFLEFIGAHNLQEFNSILCNVYPNKGSKIAPHMDNTALLKEGKVVSFSFAIHEQDENQVLAHMVFKDDKESHSVELSHGTRVEFDAFDDAKRKRKHEVRSTRFPRLNLTFRVLK